MKKMFIGLSFFFLFIDLAISAPPTVCMVTTEPNNPLRVLRIDCDPVPPQPFTNKSTLIILKNIKGGGGLRNLSVTTLGNQLIYTLDNL